MNQPLPQHADPSDPLGALLGLALLAAGGAGSMHLGLPRRALEAAGVYLGLPRRVADLEAAVKALQASSDSNSVLLVEIHQATVPPKTPKEGKS